MTRTHGHLYVQRSFWKPSLQEKPKSAASRAGVPVVDQLAKILEAHRNGFADADVIFAGPKLGRALDLKNLANRIITSSFPHWKRKRSSGTDGTHSGAVWERTWITSV